MENNLSSKVNRRTGPQIDACLQFCSYLEICIWFFLNVSISFWKEVISKKYLGSKNFFEVSPKFTNSSFWKSALKQMEFLKSSICYQINNGTCVRIWVDPWIPTIPSFMPIPNPDFFVPMHNLKVSELTLEEPRCWNTLLLDTLFSEITSRKIQKIPSANHNFHHTTDKIKWVHHFSGIFFL